MARLAVSHRIYAPAWDGNGKAGRCGGVGYGGGRTVPYPSMITYRSILGSRYTRLATHRDIVARLINSEEVF